MGKSEFKASYCGQLIEHMARGLSFASFAGALRVSRQTLYRWQKAHAAFAEAKELGEARCLLFWEELGIKGASGQLEMNTGAWIFNMKNRFDWRDMQHHRHGLTQEVLDRMPRQELDARAARALDFLERDRKDAEDVIDQEAIETTDTVRLAIGAS